MWSDDWFPSACTFIFVRRCPLKSFLNFRAHSFCHLSDWWRQRANFSHHKVQFPLRHLIFNGGSWVISLIDGQFSSFILESSTSKYSLEHWLFWPEKQTWIKQKIWQKILDCTQLSITIETFLFQHKFPVRLLLVSRTFVGDCYDFHHSIQLLAQ